MNTVRWLIAVPLGVFGTFLICMNCVCLVASMITKRHHSLVPIVGGGCCAVAMLIVPLDRMWRWAWLPLILDLGCLYAVLAFGYVAIVTKGFNNK